MNGPPAGPATLASLPKAVVTIRRRSFPVVWVVPLVGLLIAGYLVHDRAREYGPSITIMFKDGSGLRVGQTPIKYRGVPVGEVTAVELSNDRLHVLATARLSRAAASLAQEGAAFWIVRPEVGLGSVTGLSTVMTGPEVQMLPGRGGPRSQFVGLDSAPPGLEHKGLAVVLHCAQLGSLKPNSPVFYRGIEVGTIQSAQLSADATSVNIRLIIWQRYAHLVGATSKFWKVGGAQVSGGVFQGVKIKLDSLSTLVTSGIAFATADNAGAHSAKNGAEFPLYDDAQKEWLEWTPRIPVQVEQ